MQQNNKIPLGILNECEIFLRQSQLLIDKFEFQKAHMVLSKLARKIAPFKNHREAYMFLASYHQEIGNIQRDTGEPEKAYYSYIKSNQYIRGLDRPDKIAENISYIGATYEMRKEHKKSYDRYKLAFEYFNVIDEDLFLEHKRRIQLRIGTIYTKEGEFKLAKQQFDDCYHLFENSDVSYIEEKKGLLAIANEDFDVAHNLLKSSQKNNLENILQISRTHIALADLYGKINDKNELINSLSVAYENITKFNLGHLEKSIDKISSRYLDKKRKRFYKVPSSISIVILTALPIEYSSIASFLDLLSEKKHPKGTIYETGFFKGKRTTFSVTIAEIGSGNVATAYEAERAIEFCKPQYIFFSGIAGGIKDVALGDVVVANKIYGYESGQDKKEFLPRPNVGECSYKLEQQAKSEARKNSWINRLDNIDSDSKVPEVFIGAIAAGEKVVKSQRSSISKFIKKNYSDTLAVEMEGRGFLSATRASNIHAIVIRGISDLLSNKAQSDNEGYQEIAAINAAAFTFEIISNLE